MNPVSRLLRKNISVGQTIGYALANLVGLAIVLTAVLFYRDMDSATAGEDTFLSEDYMILSKRIEGLGSLMGGKVEFSDSEIEDMQKQPWCADIGKFSAADYDIFATLDFGDRRVSTSLFLEAIPDRFFDELPRNWGYKPGASDEELPEVPLVISRDYLALYNFGYAQSRGLPQISEAMVSLVPLRLSLSGDGRQAYVNARIVGFSNRLNTIAVPQEFLDYTNGRFSTKPSQPSRLIVKLNKAGDPEATKYFEEHKYEVAGDKLDNGRAAFFLRTITGVVISVGAVISLLAFFILLLSLWLLLHKNREKLQQLMLLGYTPANVAMPYSRYVVVVNVVVGIVAMVVALLARVFWAGPMESLGLAGASPWFVVVIDIAIVALVTLGSIFAIRRHIRNNFA